MIGVPHTIAVHERTLTNTVGPFIADVGPAAISYSHTISATFGYESATVQFGATLAEALTWLDRLFCGVIVFGADTWPCWEGYISGVSVEGGGRARSISLDTMANRVRVRYTLRGLGTPQVTAAASNSTSTAIYGTKDAVVSVGTTDSTAAVALRNAYLSDRALPRAQPASGIVAQPGGVATDVTVTLTCAGWYDTLGWVLTERADTSTEQTTTQVAALIGASNPGIGAINPFLSTTTTDIEASGVSDTRQIPADTTYRQKIEQLLAKGTSAGQRLAWGVYEGRRLTVKTWAGATPSVVAYRVRYSTAEVRDGNNAPVPPWRVRPDAIAEDEDFLDPGPPPAASDAAARFYVERVIYAVDAGGYRLTLEPAAASSIDARIARLG